MPPRYHPSMKQLKPLIASFVVIAIAFGGLALWKVRSAPAGNGAGNATGNLPPSNSPASGLQYETAVLDDLPALEPLGMWPRDGQRVSGVTFWTMWQTSGYSKCRLIASSDGQYWHDIGSTGGETHFLEVDLAYFQGEVQIAVEFDERGERYRSKPRTIRFGQGGHFAQREYQYMLNGQSPQTWGLEIVGRGVRDLGTEPFLTYLFPDGLVPYTSPSSQDDSIVFGVQNPDTVREACAGFLQVYDGVTDTYDRVLIRLKR